MLRNVGGFALNTFTKKPVQSSKLVGNVIEAVVDSTPKTSKKFVDPSQLTTSKPTSQQKFLSEQFKQFSRVDDEPDFSISEKSQKWKFIQNPIQMHSIFDNSETNYEAITEKAPKKSSFKPLTNTSEVITMPHEGGGDPPPPPDNNCKKHLLALAVVGVVAVVTYKLLTDSDEIKSMDKSPIASDQVTESNLNGIGREENRSKLIDMASKLSESSSTEHQIGHTSDVGKTLSVGHKYVIMAKAETLTDEQIQLVRDKGFDVMREIASGFPNGGREITPEHYETIREKSGVTDMRSLISSSEVQELALSKKGKPIDGPVQLGKGSVVNVTNHTSFENERYIINSITPITSEVHPLEGRATWIHVIDKQT
jgi:hypothetical protein